VVNATAWSAIGIFGRQGIAFIVGIFLARIVEPEEFGLIAMITVFSSFGQTFLNFGFGKALIQNKFTSQEDLSTVFFFNLIMGLMLGSIFYFGSHLIASFYNLPILVRLTQFISLIFIFNAFAIIQRTLLLKKIDLKSETFVIVTSALISGGVAIFLACKGFGVWALAVYIVYQSFIETLLLWLTNKWRPDFVFKISSLTKFLRFALNMLSAGLFNSLAQNIDKLIIGKIFSASALGYFQRSKRFNDFARQNLGVIFSKVIFPVLSGVQDDDEKFIAHYRKTIKAIALLVTPLFFVLIVIAKPLIVFLITDKWLPSVKLLQILAVSGFIYPLSAVMVNAIAAKGRADIFFKLDVVKTILYIIGILVGSLWGITQIVIAITITGYLGFYINIHIISKLIHLSVKDQLNDIATPIILSISMLILLFIISYLINLREVSQLFILPLIGFAFYLIANYVFDPKMFFEMKNIVQKVKA